MTTKDIEKVAYEYFWAKGVYMCYEIAAPKVRKRQTRHRERVDLLIYEAPDVWKCMEIKNTVSDFHSSAKLSWWGDYNSYILNSKVYDKVKDEIPDNIGVYLVYEDKEFGMHMKCVKKPKKMTRKFTNDQLMFALMQGLSREYKKYRNIKDEEKSVKTTKRKVKTK